MRRVLVTGGAGVIGTLVIQQLKERGWYVRSLVHKRPTNKADDTVYGDLRDASTLADAVRGIDTICHLAAVTHARNPARYFDVNLTGTTNLLRAAGSDDVQKWVLVSTRAASLAGGAYSRSKLAAEAALERSNIPYTTIRLPEVFGGSSVEGIDRIVDDARQGQRIFIVGDGDYRLQPAYIDDAVKAITNGVDAVDATNSTLTLGRHEISLNEFAELCIEIFTSPSNIFHIPEWLLSAASPIARVLPLPIYPDQLARLRCSKPMPTPDAWQLLHVAPRDLRSGLRELLSKN